MTEQITVHCCACGTQFQTVLRPGQRGYPLCNGACWTCVAEARKRPWQILAENERLREQRDAWHRRFNRIEAAVSHHKRDCERNDVPDTHDESLWAARDRVLRDAQSNAR